MPLGKSLFSLDIDLLTCKTDDNLLCLPFIRKSTNSGLGVCVPLPTNSYVRALTLNVMTFGGRPFGEVIRFIWSPERGGPYDEISVLLRKGRYQSSLFAMWGYSKKAPRCLQVRGRASPELSHNGPLISGFPASTAMRNKCWLFKLPISGILL